MSRLLACLLLLLAAPAVAAPLACLWDYDTLKQEESRFPSTLELLTGRFPRHSEAYYRWRITDREQRRAAGEESPELFDDLAVALSKLEENARAIELMAEKEALFPGLYETAANLGTFHIHAGEFEQGATHIARAIEINPDAHFGREIYQELLVRYVLETRAGATTLELPLQTETVDGNRGGKHLGFWGFVRRERETAEEDEPAEIARAVQGVLGMMRFGNYDSPVLCEALSDLLLADWNTDAKRLASWALLQASYKVSDERARESYRAKAQGALLLQTAGAKSHRQLELGEVEAQFMERLERAAVWHGQLVENEQRWIEAGEDVDARFAETYYGSASMDQDAGGSIRPLVLVGLALAVGVVITGVALAMKRR